MMAELIHRSPTLRETDSSAAATVDISVYVGSNIIRQTSVENVAGGSSIVHSVLVARNGASTTSSSSSSAAAAAAAAAAGNLVKISVNRKSSSSEIVKQLLRRLRLNVADDSEYELFEVIVDNDGHVKSERRLGPDENPMSVQRLWQRRTTCGSLSDSAAASGYNFELRHRSGLKTDASVGGSCTKSKVVPTCDESSTTSSSQGAKQQLVQHHHHRLKDYPDLCDLPDLNEATLLENLRLRFLAGNIYTYVGAILVAINPFRYYPIYNPKYVKLYQGHVRRKDLPPHIFAIADAAYTTMTRRKMDQCIVISGESGSGKTESSNFLLHHLSALSRRVFYADTGVEQGILNAGPVLEAFGNAKTVHNNNSSRFGKFVQINYRQNGTVQGASIDKYLLEKSRIVKQASNERNYHVFYYLLAGASAAELEALSLTTAQDYSYLNQSNCYCLDGVNSDSEEQEFKRLQHSMEAVGLLPDTQTKIFTVLSAILHLGNIEFVKKSEHGFHDDAVNIGNLNELAAVSRLLKVTESTLVKALTTRKTLAGGETVVMSYRRLEAIAARDAMAKCLYSALFDWIVLQINTMLMSKLGNRPHQGNSIGVLDIFGFEDFAHNGFEQFCINYANEALHFYFNQHIFKFEQEEYRREGIHWTNIDFVDNTGCLELFVKKPTGLLSLLDEESNLPGQTNETLLSKFNSQHQSTPHYEAPPTRQSAFSIIHYAGKVKYYIADFREKNSDLMQRDLVALLKNSNFAFLHELVGEDPLAVLRWALVRVFFRAFFAFIDAGRRHRKVLSSSMDRYGGIRLQSDRQRRQLLLSDSNMQSEFSPERSMSSSDKLRIASPNRKHSLSPSDLREKQHHQRVSRHVSSPTPLDKSRSTNRTFLQSGVSPTLSTRLLHAESSEFESTPTDTAALSRSNSRLNERNKFYKPRRTARLKTMQCITAAAAGGKTGLGSRKSKGKPPSISAQFNYSLQRLMDTLNQANPFFIRCIKSNATKAAGEFDPEVVQRQLRYTGMLATVQIRQAGYNYRLPFQDFIYEYALLLPRGRLSSRADIQQFLCQVQTANNNYQLGETKVFLRESVKQLLEEQLHQAIVERVRLIQTWFRAKLLHRRYVLLQRSITCLQSHIRGVLARRNLVELQLRRQNAATTLQRAYRQHRDSLIRHFASVVIQSYFRGYLTRRWCKETKRQQSVPQRNSLTADDVNISSKESETSVTAETKPQKTGLAEVVLIVRDILAEKAVKKAASLAEQELSNSDAQSQAGNSTASNSVVVFNTENLFKPLSIEVKLCQDNTGNLPSPVHSNAASDSSSVFSVKFTTSSPKKSLESPVSSLSRDRLSSDISFPPCDSTDGSVAVDSVSGGDSRNETRSEQTSEFFCETKVRDRDSEASSSSDVKSLLVSPSTAEANRVLSGAQNAAASTPLRANVTTASQTSSSTTTVVVVNRPDNSRHVTPSKPILSGRSPQTSPSTQRKQDTSDRSFTAVLSMSLRTQQGPQDIQVEIPPVVVTASSAETIYSSTGAENYQKCTDVFQQKIQLAPLARPESICDNALGDIVVDPDPGVETLTITLDDEVFPSRRSHEVAPSGKTDKLHRTDTSASAAALSKTSPFQRGVMKNIFKPQLRGPPKEIVGSQLTSNAIELPEVSHLKQKQKGVAPTKQYGVGKAGKVNLVETSFGGTATHNSSGNTSISGSGGGAGGGGGGGGTWTVSGTSQWQYPTETILHSAVQIRHFQQFLSGKMAALSRFGGGHESAFDEVFNNALKTFYENLIATDLKDGTQYKYSDLMSRFEDTLLARARTASIDDSFPVTVGINGFRGFLDEFVKKLENKELPEVKIQKVSKKASVKGKKKKIEHKENSMSHYGHRFAPVQFNIYTVCELCMSGIWVLDKADVCKDCRMTVHRKCVTKLTTHCRGSTSRPSLASLSQVKRQQQSIDSDNNTTVGCAAGTRLLAIVDRLVHEIETVGLFTVGIYRKPGQVGKVKKLLYELNTSPDISAVKLNDVGTVHTLTSVLKSVLRDMPEPLLTFDLYPDFIAASEITDDKEKIQTIYALIHRLPAANYELLEKLIFHLTRVAQQEASNCMTPQGLAIVFAPTILRTSQQLSPVDSLRHVGNQAKCIQCIIETQLKKMQSGLDYIMTLDKKAVAVNDRLTVLKTSQRHPNKDLLVATADILLPSVTALDEVEAQNEQAEMKQLCDEIACIQEERDTLTYQLPTLECRVSSSEDDLLSNDDLESVADDIYDVPDSDSPLASNVVPPDSTSKVVRALTRHRAHQPLQLRKTPPYVVPVTIRTPTSPPIVQEDDDDDSDASSGNSYQQN